MANNNLPPFPAVEMLRPVSIKFSFLLLYSFGKVLNNIDFSFSQIPLVK